MAENQDNQNNPFSNLFEAKSENTLDVKTINPYEQKINTLIENTFFITLRKVPRPDGIQLIFMEDIQSSSSLLNLDFLDQALFERLLLETPADYLIPNNQKKTPDTDFVIEKNVLLYLFSSYIRNEKHQDENENDTIIMGACKKINELIFRNVCTALKQPELFNGQSLNQQFLTIFQNMDNELKLKANFLSLTFQVILSDDEEDKTIGMNNLRTIFYPLLNDVQTRVKTSTMINLEQWIIPFLRCFTQDKQNPQLCELLLDYLTPPDDSDGIKYAETLLGQLLSLSILPKTQNSPYEYYENPMESQSSNLTSTLWNYYQSHLNKLHTLIKDILVIGGVVRDKMLNWIGNCLHSNAARGQIWNTHQMQPLLGNLKTGSDSFLIGLCGVLLRLCKPLVKPSLKVMIVDPTYCAVPESERQQRGVHMKNVDKETCMVSTSTSMDDSDENDIRIIADKYNFVTECFFMTHKAIDLSYRVCIEKLIRQNREIHRLQSTYQDTMNESARDVSQNVLQMLTTQMQQFLCLQNTIVEPVNDQLLLQFYEASAIFLTQIAATTTQTINDNNSTVKGYAPQIIKEINLPLTNTVPTFFKSIPEYVIENIVGYLTFSRHFETQAIESNPDSQNSIFTMILIFMGNSDKARNPHLRAKLAEGLESLLPKQQQQQQTNSFRGSYKNLLFANHPHRLEILPNLLRVFVEIEMTGQSVQFEQKFNYRRPMYTIMEYLWGIERQRECFKNLAIDAEKNIESENPPIFLRFINLLINDAIFLLDESLSNLQQIRTLQAAQDNGEWNSLTNAERQQNRASLQQLGMMAKFDNILGRDTIHILTLLTTEIKGIFCHSSIVDRMAAMLNYFLLHLVGPKKSTFKVKDNKEFEFDPAHTVREICRIYVNLQENRQFCLAVSQDGRSYSQQLFEYAEQVLIRIGGGQLIGEINEFSLKVQELDQQQKEDQAALQDPPDEFLDPIMSTLMMDPVILPSSKVTLDRTTIARHLLSDQIDPFNRSQLTMDQIQTNNELKEKINQWISERRQAYKNRDKTTMNDEN